MSVRKRTQISKRPRFLRIAAALLCVCVIAAILLFRAYGTASDSVRQDGADALKESIINASEQCYAIEGAYPPSLEYLSQHYGIRIDEDVFNVTYSIFASNVQPVVTVALR